MTVQFYNWKFSGGSTCKSFRARPPPNRTKFFRFYICFHRKVPVSEVGAPSNEGWRPPMGNPGSAPGNLLILLLLKGVQLKRVTLIWIESYNQFLRKVNLSALFLPYEFKYKISHSCLLLHLGHCLRNIRTIYRTVAWSM